MADNILVRLFFKSDYSSTTNQKPLNLTSLLQSQDKDITTLVFSVAPFMENEDSQIT